MRHYNNISIRIAIIEHELTEAQFAKILGISRPQMCVLLKGDLSAERKNAMLKALDGDLSEWKKTYNRKNIRCIKCNRGMIKSYNYCPYCGEKIIK